MKGLLYLVNIVNFFVVLSFLVYYPVVYMNTVFTNNYLSYTDIPYYVNQDKINVFDVYWWLFATDLLRIIAPIIMLFSISMLLSFGSGWAIWSEVVLAGLFLVDLVKLIWRASDWAHCSTIDYCRNFDSTVITSSDNINPNYIFLFIWFYNLAFLAILVLYGYLTTKMEDERSIHYKYLHEDTVYNKRASQQPKLH